MFNFFNLLSNLADSNIPFIHDEFLGCPYADCPSNDPFMGAMPPKIRFVQKLAPLVHQYRCKYCSCLYNKSVEKLEAKHRDRAASKNPSLLGYEPSYRY